MNSITNQHFTGERALFKAQSQMIDGCIFDDGESPLKESHDINVTIVVHELMVAACGQKLD